MTNHREEAERVAALADNYDRADHFSGAVGVSIGVESLVQAQIAQVHATLYLAEQQRIANLMTLLSAEDDIAGVEWDGLKHIAIRAEIREGMGL